MAALSLLLNRCVRAYLAYSPVTEGKRLLLSRAKPLIRPRSPEQTARTKHGFSLRLNLANPEQERIYYYGEHDERYETALLKALLTPGMTCWDIGANIGFYTCLMATRVGARGSVVAFEPARATRGRLEHNVALNGLRNVRVMPCAVAASEGEAEIHYASASLFEGTASLRELPGQVSSERVKVSTLDRLAHELPAPDVLKIDVEGAQLEVWRGGAQFFRAHAPLVMAELRESDDAGALARLEAEVRRLGYEIYAIGKRCRLRLMTRLTPDGPRNYLLAKGDSRFGAALRARSA